MSEKEQTLEKLTAPIQFVQGTDWSVFHSRVDERLVAKMGCLVNAYQRVTPQGLNEMPVKQLKEFLELTKQIQKGIEEAMSRIRQEFPSHEVVGGLLGGVEEQCDAALLIAQECADRGGGTKARRKEVETLLAEMRGQKEEMESLNQAAKADSAERKASFQQEVDGLQKTVVQLGVSLHAAFFKQEADKHEKAAEVWKKGVWGAAAVLAVYAVVSMFFPAVPWLDGVAPLQLAVSRTLVFIVLGYALLFCARNYAAERHNAVVNRHRHNALMTYRALVRANKNLEGADIVLTQAARFIYAPQDSGYARGGSGGGGISIETIRRIADDKRGGE